MFKKFFTDTRGASAIEYCLIASFVSLAIVAGALSIGSSLNTHAYTPAGNIFN
jgi:pilus assembly protein Flp/PilA